MMHIDKNDQGGWNLGQYFGDPTKSNNDSEIISSIEYDKSGDYLVTGNKAGRMVIYSRNDHSSSARMYANQQVQYSPYTDFQSHNAEFDYLKSLEIEEKINQIKWCRPSNNSLFLLSTNDKTIKLWKVHDRHVKEVSEFNTVPNQSVAKFECPSSIKIPRLNISNTVVAATSKRVFSNAHAYHINSISLNSDGETYLSADDLRINLWSLGLSDQSFNIVDIKPSNMEELTEVITAADFHPSHCNIMMYSSSRGTIKLGDMRQAALCDAHAKIYEEHEDPQSRSFFSEIIASISDIKFSPDGRYVLARDYLTLKVWDLNMESKPVQTIQIHDNLEPKLCDLYDNDCIFDKFECSVSGDGCNYITGSYNSECHIYDRYGKSDFCLRPKSNGNVGRRHSMSLKASLTAASNDPGVIDFSKKVLQTAWHPTLNEVTVASKNNLFIYSKTSNVD